MAYTSTNQKGFSRYSIMLAVAVVLLGLAGGLGWRIYKEMHDNNPSDSGKLEMPGESSQTSKRAEQDQSKPSQEEGIMKAALNFCQNQGVTDEQAAQSIIARSMQDASLFVQAGSFVRLNMSCSSTQGSLQLYLQERSDGSWANIGATQDKIPSCSILDGLNVPAVIASECMGRDGQKRPVQPAS